MPYPLTNEVSTRLSFPACLRATAVWLEITNGVELEVVELEVWLA
jgi:hypothetical protein